MKQVHILYCTKPSNIKAPRCTLISVICARATTVHIMENKEQVTEIENSLTIKNSSLLRSQEHETKSLAIDKENATGTAFYRSKPVCLPFARVLYSGSSLKKKFSTRQNTTKAKGIVSSYNKPVNVPFARALRSYCIHLGTLTNT